MNLRLLSIVVIVIAVFMHSYCLVVPKELQKIDFSEIRAGESEYHVVELKRQNLENSTVIFGTFKPAPQDGIFLKYSAGWRVSLQ